MRTPEKRLCKLGAAIFLWLIFLSGSSSAAPLSMEETCRAISSKLASVGYQECLDSGLTDPEFYSCGMIPLLFKEYPPLDSRRPKSRVLVVGGTHGDEYASVSVVFKWMNILDVHHSGLFHWIFIPLLNPDGLLRNDSTRTNARGVDLNRNFPSPLWKEVGYQRWVEDAGENPRYYPGSEAMSEPETFFLVNMIRKFAPDAIISVHTPLGLVDFDGPGPPPSSIAGLELSRLGNFPGTLGNFAGVHLGIPVITLELSSSGRMPSSKAISVMWMDLVRWLINNTPVEDRDEYLRSVQHMDFRMESFGK